MGAPEVTKSQRQIATQAGTTEYKFRLSRIAVERMKKAAAKLSTDKLYWSQSLLVRRALKVYADHVDQLTTEAELNEERLQVEVERTGR
jgi:hypothetical protein